MRVIIYKLPQHAGNQYMVVWHMVPFSPLNKTNCKILLSSPFQFYIMTLPQQSAKYTKHLRWPTPVTIISITQGAVSSLNLYIRKEPIPSSFVSPSKSELKKSKAQPFRALLQKQYPSSHHCIPDALCHCPHCIQYN